MLLLSALAVYAQTSIQVQSHKVVSIDEQFNVTFVIEGAKPTDFSWDPGADFDLVWGPQQGRSTSVQIINGKRTESSQTTYSYILRPLKAGKFTVESIVKKERSRKPFAPFTTSSLQQDAYRKMNFTAKKTMRVAQQLYEGISLGKGGAVGLITYMRTDSTRIADVAKADAANFIKERYGEQYLPKAQKDYKNKNNAQNAHEAIRPTDISRTPISLKDSLSRDQYRLYQLIWKRFTASRMQQAKYETTSVKIQGGEYYFTVAASKLKFDGFMTVYTQDDEEKQENQLLVKSIDENTEITLKDLKEQQHFTQPPAHYTEASLVKTLEELGIGRPSTYAPTITTIIARRYVAKEGKNLYITELGEIVNDMMKRAFPSIVNTEFTANVEGLLDYIADGSVKWKTVVRNFYPDLEEAVSNAEKELENVKIADEVTDILCEECGRNMVIKYGPHGKFLACPGFPDCRNTKAYLEKIGVACPQCGKDLVIRKSKKGRKYYGCENNPECDYMTWQKPKAAEAVGEK